MDTIPLSPWHLKIVFGVQEVCLGYISWFKKTISYLISFLIDQFFKWFQLLNGRNKTLSAKCLCFSTVMLNIHVILKQSLTSHDLKTISVEFEVNYWN